MHTFAWIILTAGLLAFASWHHDGLYPDCKLSCPCNHGELRTGVQMIFSQRLGLFCKALVAAYSLEMVLNFPGGFDSGNRSTLAGGTVGK